MPIASAFRSVLHVFGAAVIALLSPVLLAQSSVSTAADGFDPNFDGHVYALAMQPDGKMVIGGSFTMMQPNGSLTAHATTNIARLRRDGTYDDSWSCTVNGQINAIVRQPNGQFIIGGKFTEVDGVTLNRVARINADGSLDQTFDPNIEPDAYTPTNDASLTPDVMGLALQPDGAVLVVGGFKYVKPNGGERTKRYRVARFKSDGSLDATFDPSANNMVLSVAVQNDGRILIGGGFTKLNGGAVEIARLARLSANGAVDTAFAPTPDNAVATIVPLSGGKVLIGGSFTSFKPNGTDTAVSTHQRISRLNADGTLDTTFTGYADAPVSTLQLQSDGMILAGGLFSAIGNGSRSYVARLLPNGTVDVTFRAAPNYAVYAFGEQADGSLIIAGGFSTVTGGGTTSTLRGHVARVLPSGALDADFRPDVNGRLRTIALLSNGQILAAGSFTSIAGKTRSGIVRLNADGSVDTSFTANVNGTVLAAAEQADGRILIGGSFTQVSGMTRPYFARLEKTGAIDAFFNCATNGIVNAIKIQSDGKVIVGGNFTTIAPLGTTEPVTRSYVARLNTDQTLDLAFKPVLSGATNAIAIQGDGKIVLGGAFTTVVGSDAKQYYGRYGMARLNQDGTVDPVFNPNVNGTIYAVALQSDGKVVFGGIFQQLAPNGSTSTVSRGNVARVNADGTIDAGFDPHVSDTVATIAIQSDGKIVLGGLFTSLSPNGGAAVARNYVVRVNADGTLDTSFDLNLDFAPGNGVSGLGVTSGGKIVLGGAFTRLTAHGQTVARSRIAQINADGSIDTAFNSDLSSAAGPAIEALITQPDGLVIAAGSFSGINGTVGTNLAGFSADGAPVTSFSPAMDGAVHTIALRPTSGAPVTTQRTGFAWLKSSGEINPTFKLPDNVTFSTIRAVAFDNSGRILVAGDMSLGGVSAVFARFNADGSLDSTFDYKPSGTIYSVVVQPDNKILLGGTFTTVGDVTRNNFARLNADGSLDADFNPNVGGSVFAAALQSDGKIVIGGAFTTVQPNGATSATTRSYIARLNGDGSVDTEFNPTADYTVQAIVVQSDQKIVIGGSFSTLRPNGATTATSRTFFARLNTNGTLDDTVSLSLNSTVGSIVQQADGKLVIGGYFTSIGGATRNYVARVNTDGTLDTSFNPNPNGSVATVALQSDGKLLITGYFTALEPNSTAYDSATATPRNHAARLNTDGTIDTTFNPNFDAAVTRNVIAPDGTLVFTGSFTSIQPTGQLLAGGAFSTINGLPVSNLALFSSDGSISATFQPNPNGAVYALVPAVDERLVVAGSFTKIAGATRNHIARFTADNALDTSFDPNIDGDVYAVALQGDGKLVVGGSFTKVGGVARSNLVRLNADGTIDGSFVGTAAGAVHVLVVQPDGRVLFTRESGTDRVLGRLNADGSLDGSFNPAHDGSVLAVALQTDGHLVVGGTFTTIGGAARSRIARLNPDGTLDGTVVATPNGPVTALEVQPDGKLLLGGSFTAIDDLPRFGLARLAAPARAMRAFTLSEDRNTVTWVRAGGSPEVAAVIFETSTDASTWTELGYGVRVGTSGSWRYTGLNAGSATGIYIRARGTLPSSPHSSSGVAAAQQWLDLTAKPVITSATVLNGAAGSDFYYATTATNQPTSFSVAGLPPGLSFDATTGVLSGKPTQAGTYLVTLTAMNANGSSSTTITLIVASGTEDPGRMINLSINGHVTADNPIITGFVIKGTSAQNVLLRAVGPGLQSVSTITNPLAAPHLRLFDRNGQLLSETASWGGGDTLRSTFTRLGAFPLADNSTDAAILVTLMPGVYTMHVIDSGTQGGRALAEVYDASANPPPVNAPRLINLSARGVVSPGESVTGGFVIRGTSSKRILIRGVGPTLATQGVPSVLVNPVVTLYRSSAAIARNDDWQTPVTTDASYPAASGADLSAAATSTGAFALPAGSKDAAILLTLAPGIYTAEVTSADGGTGAALVEAYEVP